MQKLVWYMAFWAQRLVWHETMTNFNRNNPILSALPEQSNDRPPLEMMGNKNDFWTLTIYGSSRKQSWSRWAGSYLRSLVNLIIKYKFEYRTSWGSGLHGRKRTGQTQIIEHNAESDVWITVWIKVREQKTVSQWSKVLEREQESTIQMKMNEI